jgi:hypothetical protein
MTHLREKFTEFYKKKYSGRNLQWQPALGYTLVKGHISSKVKFLIFKIYFSIKIHLFSVNIIE